MGLIEILDPAGVRRHQDEAMPEFPRDLNGRVIGFLDNGKPNTDLLLDRIAEVMGRRFAFGAVVREQKRTNGGARPELLDRLAGCDLVINGLGD